MTSTTATLPTGAANPLGAADMAACGTPAHLATQAAFRVGYADEVKDIAMRTREGDDADELEWRRNMFRDEVGRVGARQDHIRQAELIGREWALEFVLDGGMPANDERLSRFVETVEAWASEDITIGPQKLPPEFWTRDEIEAHRERERVREAALRRERIHAETRRAVAAGKPAGGDRRRWEIVRVADLEPSAPAWLITDFIERGTLVAINGDPGSGKSFIAIDMGLCIAAQRDWAGHRVEYGRVCYVCGEGFNGVLRRVHAWALHHGVDLATVPFHVAQMPMLMSDDESCRFQQAVDELGPFDLVVIDTLARSMAGGEENATKDMAVIVRRCEHIRRAACGATVLLVHHTGHGDKSRGRGSSALRGALDSEFLVEKTCSDIALMATKAKDSELPAALHASLKPVALNLTREGGKPVTSAVLEYRDANVEQVVQQAKKRGRKSKWRVVAMQVARRCLTAGDGEPVPVEMWREQCELEGLTARSTWMRTLQSLIDEGAVTLRNEHLIEVSDH